MYSASAMMLSAPRAALRPAPKSIIIFVSSVSRLAKTRAQVNHHMLVAEEEHDGHLRGGEDTVD